MKKPIPQSIRKSISLLKTCILLISLTFTYFLAEAQNQTAKVTPIGTWYYEYLPPDYNTNTNNYPIVFFLHGIGERGDTQADLPAVARNGPPKYVKAGYKFPFILISPQLKTSKSGWPLPWVDEVVEYVRHDLRVDQSRIYITGLSLGGAGSWGYIQDPILGKKIAASVICCGSRNTPSMACNIVNNGIPVWAHHGLADTTVPYARTVSMVNAINACVPAPNPLALINLYPGVNHNCWDLAFRTDHSLYNPNVYEWLLQYKNGGVIANAGPDISLTLPLPITPISTTISGTAATDVGTVTTYAWTEVSGPVVTLVNAGTPTVSITNIVTAGVYTFRLTATTDNGDVSTDDVKVTVTKSTTTNAVPVANAGADKAITLPTNSLSLTGTGSDTDGSIKSYLWTKVSGPAATLTNTGTAVLSLSALVAGTYVFQLTVTDNLNATGTDQVTVVVNPSATNQIPTANAGVDKVVNLPTNTLNIAGTGSDPDGSISTYAWTKISGPTVTIGTANAATVSLSSLIAGVYVFQLTVTDNQGAPASDQVTVTVLAANQSPTANAGVDIVLTQPTSSTNITGSGTDPDGSIKHYKWTFVSGPTTPTLANDTITTVTVSALSPNVVSYVFRLTVTDNKGSTGFDDVKVTVNALPANVPPTANAGADKSITLPVNSVTLNGVGNDPDGGSITYSWIKVSGPAAILSNATTASLTADNLLAGTYVFRLTVTDNQAASATDDVQVIVQPAVVNLLPVANAGADIILTLPTNTTTINGSGTDADGTITTYSWTKLTGPATVTLGVLNAPSLQLTNLGAGTYTFQLTVTDDKLATNSDAVTVTVNAANVPPTANAGSDITITSPTSTTLISGSGTNSDGPAVSIFSWAQVGTTPSVAVLDPLSINTATLSVSGLGIGTYTFRLTVTDDKGDSGFDDVKVIVNAPANQSPTANAGADQIITLPTSSANFTGLGTDPDGTIATYSWTLLTSPPSVVSAPIITNQNTNTLSVDITDKVNLGTYTFHLLVTDNSGATDFDDVTLTINPAANKPPVANAGANQSITLPLNTLNLTGSGSDTDGSIATYLWTLQGGPTATLTNSDKATLSLSNLLEGVYTFRLTVTDDGGLSDFDETTVTVLPMAVNQQPTANAGVDQIILQNVVTPPLVGTTLFGSGSDPDGSIATYAWTFISGPTTPGISNSDKPTTAITDLATTPTGNPYVFRLIVTDNLGSTDTDDITVTVNAPNTNQPPTANAGKDKVITLPTNIATLNGSGSDPDAGDFITSYLWAKVSGPSVTLGVTTNASLSLSDLVEGVYVFRLEVQDNDNTTPSATDDVKVTVLPASINQSPVVVTDADKSIFLATGTTTTSVTISGSASDADGSVKSYLWTQASGAAIAPADMVNTTTTNLTVNNLVVGVYTFQLTATDNLNATGSDVTKVTVFADTVNQPPQANAGIDQNTNLTTVTLTGSGSDADGTIASYLWTKIGGPVCTLPALNTATIVITGMDPGNYQFGLIVTDNKNKNSVQDVVDITILPTSINQPPVANAGSDVSIQLPITTPVPPLSGSATDDGTTLTSSWEQISGPSTILASPTTATTVDLSAVVAGTYVFRFTANDNDPTSPFTDSDDVSVIVYPEPTINTPPTVVVSDTPPTVNAGDTIRITLPQNTVKLFADAVSSDGLIESYKWTEDPANANSVNISVDTTAFLDLSGLTVGKYGFIITVKDNDAQEAIDEVYVVVKPEPSQPNNVFTPNNKGPNETWYIGDINDFVSCEINVYNRQGLKVFNSLGYSDPGWNGTFNGQALPEGVYFYVIGCPNTKAKTGTVTIIR